MDFPIYFFSFLIGAALGSFLNVIVIRFEKEETLFGRSHCMFCKKILAWFELIPVFSYLVQYGKCRSCKATVSAQYILVEIMAGVLGMLIARFFLESNSFLLETSTLFLLGDVARAVFLSATWFFLLAALVSDMRTKLIPDIFILAATAAALGFLLLSAFMAGVSPLSSSFALALIAGPLFALPFFCLWYFSKETWMGFGDVLLALPLGLLVGVSGVISAFLLAFWIGALVALFLMALQKVLASIPKCSLASRFGAQLSMRSEVPFGPFLILGTALVFFCKADVFSFLSSLFPYVF